MLLAKNHYEKNILTKETLVDHTIYCLKVAKEIVKVFPETIESFGNDRQGEKMVFLMIYLHDLGKAARAFQEKTLNLKTKENWNFRHEVLSAEFVNLIGNNITNRNKKSIQIAILGHHEKNIKELSKISYQEEDIFVSMFGFSEDY